MEPSRTLHGASPASMQKAHTPTDQQSDSNPSYARAKTSGAWYEREPVRGRGESTRGRGGDVRVDRAGIGARARGLGS